MELGEAGLQQQPFRLHGKPLVFVPYEAQRQAHAFLCEIYEHRTGLGIFLGPTLSGKTTVLRSFTTELGDDAEFAIVDGAGLNTTALLHAVLGQFGFQLDFNSVNELINMLKVLVMQRTASAHAPLLVIENTHAMNPSALRVLCELAQLQVKQQSALRLVLASDRSIDHIVKSPVMQGVSSRLTREFHLGPMTHYETCDYLYEKLRAGGCSDPDNVIPDSVCDEFYVASGGWPGILDRLALLGLANAQHCPLTREHVEHPVLPTTHIGADTVGMSHLSPQDSLDGPPQLILTSSGKTLKTVTLDKSRIIVGRSEHTDLRINSRFISRHHVLFIRNRSSTFMMDLNSTNGTFVNSKRVSNQVMNHNDVVSLGNHRIKFVHPGAKDKVELDGDGYSDTVIMKTLHDMRRMLARENTQSMEVPPANKPAGGKPDK